MFTVSYPSSTLAGNTIPNNAQTFPVKRCPSTFFFVFVIQIWSAVWWVKKTKKTEKISVLDPFSVRAHDSVWTRNLHPRQQSGFHHRVIAVKPLLTGWCGSQGLVKCNVPRDLILAIALLHWDSFLFFYYHLFSFFLFLLPPLHFHCLSIFLPIFALVCWCC